MKNIVLAAEYCRIIGVKRIGLFYRACNDPSVTVLDEGNIFLISFTAFYVFIEIRPAFTLFASWLHVAGWIFVSVSPYIALLLFFY